MAVLDVKHLSYYYIDGDSRRDIFDDVNVSFDEGCFYAILGESGCGKTTFLSILGGMDFRYEGEVFYLGKEIQSLGLDRYRRCGVSLIYQNYHLIPHLSAVENCLVAVDISDNVSEIDVDEIKSVLCRFGIGEDKYNRKVKKLSGGEQQRVAVARSILTKAPIILADEPTGNLDSESAMVIVKAFVDLAHKMNKCVIMVTHNDRLAMLADEVLVMDQNRRNLFKK